MNKLKGFLALLTCAVIYASFSIFVRYLAEDFDAYQQIGFRNVIALVISIIVIVMTRQSFKSLAHVSPKYVALYTIMFPLAVVLFTVSVLQTKIITTVFGLYTGALITSLIIGLTIFKEKLTLQKTISLLLVVCGLALYAYPFDGSLFSLGFFLAVGSGFFDAVANSFRKYLAGKVDRFVLVALQMVGGLIVAFPLILVLSPSGMPSISLQSWVVGLIFGSLLIAISYLSLVGFQNFDLNLGTVILSSELFFGSLFAYLFFQEITRPLELIGGVLIIGATVLAHASIQKNTFSSFFKRLLLKP